MNDHHWAMGLQCYLSSMALYSRRLPPGYQIVLRFTHGDYSTALLTPTGRKSAEIVRRSFLNSARSHNKMRSGGRA